MKDGDTLVLGSGLFEIYPTTSEGIVIDKRIKITGCGINSTRLQQKNIIGNTKATAPVFNITCGNVVIENMMLEDYTSAKNENALVSIGADSVELYRLFFIQNCEADDLNYCVWNVSDTKFVRIEQCRVFRKISSTRAMFNFTGYSFTGVIGSIISSGNDGVKVRFKDEDSMNKTAFYGNVNEDVSYVR
jgi:hypothetical protein